MTEPASPDARRDEPLSPRAGSLEARASLALKLLAAIDIAGLVLAEFPTPLPQSLLHSAMFNLAAAALVVLEIGAAWSIDHARPWAIAVVRPLFLLIAAEGIGVMLVGLGPGTIRLPFETVVAGWVLLSRPDLRLVGQVARKSVALLAIAVVLVTSMTFGEPLFGWGGLLDVRATDFHGSIAATCAPRSSDLPPKVTVTYDWSWARTAPFPNGLDILLIGWSGEDAAGRPLYYFDVAPISGNGVYPGRRDYPSLDMADQIAAGMPASQSWGVELGDQRLAPGHVVFQLDLARDTPARPTPLVVTAVYVHLGVWSSQPVSVTCSW